MFNVQYFNLVDAHKLKFGLLTTKYNNVFQFAASECRRYPKPTISRIDLS